MNLSSNSSSTVYLGIDYHKRFLQVCLVDHSGRVSANGRCENDWQCVVQFAKRFGSVRRVAIESCNGAADLAEQLVSLAGWSVDLAHPGYVKRIKSSPDKTDFSDARLLADLTRVGYLPRVWLAPQSIRELRRLVRYRQSLVNERRAMKLRMRALLRDHRVREMPCRAWTQRWMHWIEQCHDLPEQSRWIMDRWLHQVRAYGEAIHEVEQRLHHVTAEDPMITQLLGESGIGPVTAWTLRAEIGRFDRFNSGKQVSRFCGLSPRNASSGERQADAGLIKAASTSLRATIIEAAWRLIRCDQRWGDLAQSLRHRGKPSCLIAAAIGNRWIRRLYHRMKPMGLAA